MHLIESASSPNVPSPAILLALKDKFPSKDIIPISPEDPEFQSRINGFTFPKDLDKYVISVDAMRKRLRRAKKLVKHGIDKLRYEHLCILAGVTSSKPSDMETSFLTLHTTIVTFIANGEIIPSPIHPFFQDAEISAVGDKLRPVCICGSLRKLGAMEGFSRSSSFNKEFFKNVNLAFEPAGPEQIVHSLRLSMSLYSSHDTFLGDGKNGFNSASRIRAFANIIKHLSRPFPHMLSMYGCSSRVWYFGLQDQIHPINCEVGAQ